MAYTLLITCRDALARALRECDPCYAASTYALCDALFSQRAAHSRGAALATPPLLYRHRSGSGGLAQDDPAWSRLEEPDATGFRGLTSSALVRAYCSPSNFAVDGFRLGQLVDASTTEYSKCDSDVVCFESAPDDEHGAHAAIPTAWSKSTHMLENGVFPPNTLYRLKEVKQPGEWEAPGGVRVQQRLLVVTATYRAPRIGLSAASEGGAKLCGVAVTLNYADRDAFVRGLDDLLRQPLLTMEQECRREMVWSDWTQRSYRLCDEWAYVTSPAVSDDGFAAGCRDRGHDGVTPEGFQALANTAIAERRAKGYGTRLLERDALLTLDEVIAVRLYSGPAFQPINVFLRQISQLSGEHRAQLARHPRLTFAATIGHLCRAVRKLAATATPAEAQQPLWRGVRGELPHSFWLPDGQGLVCAVDMAFMSTSRRRQTPIDYMQAGGGNVLWELQPQLESDVGFHYGADISMLSQFGHEQEVLYPPCTLLKVVGPPELYSSGAVETIEGGKRFCPVPALPTFL